MFSKHDPDFMKHLVENTALDEKTGSLKFNNLYVAVHLNFAWKSNKVFLPHSHIVWFLTRGKWPREGYVIDHINDDPQDNRPENLQELTQAESQSKRRGRMVYRSYGKGKYGYGICIHHDKRDNRYYVSRHMSRGHGKGDLKGIKYSLGGFDTLEQAERRVKRHIFEIKLKGLDHIFEDTKKKDKKSTMKLNAATDQMRKLRQQGHTIEEIKEITGFRSGIYRRIKDVKINDKREV